MVKKEKMVKMTTFTFTEEEVERNAHILWDFLSNGLTNDNGTWVIEKDKKSQDAVSRAKYLIREILNKKVDL